MNSDLDDWEVSQEINLCKIVSESDTGPSDRIAYGQTLPPPCARKAEVWTHVMLGGGLVVLNHPDPKAEEGMVGCWGVLVCI
jgi:hypothetical protein